MLWVIALITASTAYFITLCTKNVSSSGKKQPVNVSPQQVATTKDSTLNASVTPPASITPCESPPKSNHSQPQPDCTTPLESGGPSKGASPGNNTGTGTGTTPGNDGTGPTGPGTGTATPQSSMKKREQSNRSKDISKDKEEESGELLIKTVTSVADSLMEKGTTRTKEPDASKYTLASRKKKGKRKKTIMKEVTARTLQSPIRKTEMEKVKEKEKKQSIAMPQMTSSSGQIDKELEYGEEKTGKDPTDEKEKIGTKVEKDVTKETKTKEDKKSVEGKLKTAPSVWIDSTQCSHTRKDK